jgi:hypothetical protein
MATTLHAVANGELPYGFADTVIVCLFLLCCQACSNSDSPLAMFRIFLIFDIGR